MSKDLILELYSEEIPASMQQPAAAQLEKRVSEFLAGFGLEGFDCKAYAAPQRIALLVEGLPAELPARKEERKGPRIDAPEKAIEGFLRANGLTSTAELTQQEDKKGAFYVLEINEKAKSLADALAEFLPDMIRNFQWQKSMRWGAGQLRWVRPLHSILCCFGGAVVPFEIDGITSGNTTTGHRFMHNKAVKITHAKDYVAALRKAKVIVDIDERISMIKEGAEKICKDNELEFISFFFENASNEVAGLVEYPVPLLGRIDEEFMDLPPELLESVMRTHQKYLYVYEKKNDAMKIAPAFIVVSNGEYDEEKIITGNERVLRARLKDAAFFWEQDLKTTLDDKREKLKDVIFHEKIGTVYEKTIRLENLAGQVAPALNEDAEEMRKAAAWSKSDLVSQMVYEFPELQGIMGGYYVKHEEQDNNNISIVNAISYQYGPTSDMTASDMRTYKWSVALADKIDTLTQFWIIDEKPTGSKDPYALRRAAIGIIYIVMIHGAKLKLETLFYGIFTQKISDVTKAQELTEDLLDFIFGRLKVYLREKENISHDIVEAVVSVNKQAGNIWTVFDNARALKDFINTDDGANLLAAYNRAFGICKAENKLPTTDEISVFGVEGTENDPKELKDLAAAINKIRNSKNNSLESLSALRQPVDAFFEKVLINDEDPSKKRARFIMLQDIIRLMRQFAAFELIEKTD